jgi:uncharacterized HhH-GPD family protein
MPLYLSGDPDADRLISEDPLALLIAMVLDQQIPLEWAFYGPFNLQERLGPYDAARIANMPEDELVAAFAARPALHRFPASMARRTQAMCQHIVSSYGGDASALWRTAKSGAELLDRVQALPGFGKQKAKIFVALLGKQFAVKPPGWEEVARPFSESGTHLSIADIDSPEALTLVRQHKREMKVAAKAAASAKKAPARARAVKKAPATKRVPAGTTAAKDTGGALANTAPKKSRRGADTTKKAPFRAATGKKVAAGV